MAVNPLFRNKLRHFQSRYLIDEILEGHFNSYSYIQRKLKICLKLTQINYWHQNLNLNT